MDRPNEPPKAIEAKGAESEPVIEAIGPDDSGVGNPFPLPAAGGRGWSPKDLLAVITPLPLQLVLLFGSVALLWSVLDDGLQHFPGDPLRGMALWGAIYLVAIIATISVLYGIHPVMRRGPRRLRTTPRAALLAYSAYALAGLTGALAAVASIIVFQIDTLAPRAVYLLVSLPVSVLVLAFLLNQSMLFVGRLQTQEHLIEGQIRALRRVRLLMGADANGMSGASHNPSPYYQQIVDNALTMNRDVRLVILTRYDFQTQTVRFLAWSSLQVEATQQGLETIMRLFPAFDFVGTTLAPDLNEWSREVYLRGRPSFAPLKEIARGIAPNRAIRMAETIAGLRYCHTYPLKVNDEVLGALSFITTREPMALERKAFEDVARQAALAMENDRLLHTLRSQVRELQRSRQLIAVAEERVRREVAEMLHGRIQTRLLRAWHRLGECEQLLALHTPRVRALLAEVRDELDQIREQDVRQASHRLHPAIIRIGLLPAIRSLAQSFEEFFEIALHVDPSVVRRDDALENRFPESARLVVYRAVEEALNNTYKHAKANRVDIYLEAVDGTKLDVTVQDNGCGFDANGMTPGLGLNTIAAYVALVGGSWTLTSTRDRGTALAVMVPIGEKNDYNEESSVLVGFPDFQQSETP